MLSPKFATLAAIVVFATTVQGIAVSRDVLPAVPSLPVAVPSVSAPSAPSVSAPSVALPFAPVSIPSAPCTFGQRAFCAGTICRCSFGPFDPEGLR
ncbi:hypothetical protein K466DRAFT_601337 [Polyporus arcularius HHB13444]|uniref:Uncharacterized protein n=1 Tax=Polyporus arcularius HHB13444 TaxID=1314778 RepID=A0A5C3P6F7_9APHY|nr:hypothetical protein K466DRAFT_601337 [Polyporus arcularius HHB13444]